VGDDEPEFWTPCWACRVIRGESAGEVVTETRDVLVVLNPFPLGPGHALVVPRRHVEKLYELPDELAGPILSMAARVARAAKRGYAADGVTLRQNNEEASDQHLFHFHLHVIPRFVGDEERLSSRPALADVAEQQATGSRLRAALAEDDAGATFPSRPISDYGRET
jgi:histidine triad (HIT) family protein